MALYQPTNVLPDLLAGNANGTVFYDPNDLTEQVEISWTVNGNSLLTAYQIDFYKNDAVSTATYSTGKITLVTPFSAIASDGTQQRFSCKIAVSKFVDAAVAATGYTGKFKITQWWSASDYVEQRSMSAFKVNGISSISAAKIDGANYYGGQFKFQGYFTPPNPDNFDTSLVWTRWQIYVSGMTEPVQDTGKVWGATSYQWICQQPEPGNYCSVVFSAMTSMGEELEASPVSVPFGVNGDVATMSGAVLADCDKNLKAVRVRVRFASLIQGVSSPDPDFSNYIDSNGYMVLPSDASATWNIPAELSDSKWGLAWDGSVSRNGPAITITNSDGTQCGFYISNSTVYFTPGDIQVVGISLLSNHLYWFITTGTGSDANKWYLYLGYGSYTYQRTLLTGYYPSPITKIEFGGGTTTRDCRILYGDQAQVYVAATTGSAISDLLNPQIIVPYTEDQRAAEAGYALVEYFGTSVRDGALYRSVNGKSPEYFGIFSGLDIDTDLIYYDYGTATGNWYQYFVVNQNSAIMTATNQQSEMVSPCWWDWALIEAETDGVWGVYKPVNVFSFTMNVSSGSDGNGSAPGVYNNFTRYPIVMKDTVNRHSGTLSGLVGYLSAPGVYEDTLATRNALRALSTTRNPIFLRSRRGDFFRVEISGEITTAVDDNSPIQQISASVPWIEVGPADGSIVSGGTAPSNIWDGFLSPEEILAATRQMTPEEKIQMRAFIGATDETTGIADNIKLALLGAFAHTAYLSGGGESR